MRLIIVTGMPGAGKEEFLSAASGKGLPFIRMGDVVRKYYEISGLRSKGISAGLFAGNERSKHGLGIWAERATQHMNGDVLLVDGCRSMDEVRTFRKLEKKTVVLAIHASPAVRYARLLKRNRDDAPSNRTEFEIRDKREISWGLAEAIALSDIMIENMSTLEDFHKKSEKILENLI